MVVAEEKAIGNDLRCLAIWDLDMKSQFMSVGRSRQALFLPSEVKVVFSQGITQLNERLTATAHEHRVEATMARVRLRPEAIAKSHRYPTVFNKDADFR